MKILIKTVEKFNFLKYLYVNRFFKMLFVHFATWSEVRNFERYLKNSFFFVKRSKGGWKYRRGLRTILLEAPERANQKNFKKNQKKISKFFPS